MKNPNKLTNKNLILSKVKRPEDIRNIIMIQKILPFRVKNHQANYNNFLPV